MHLNFLASYWWAVLAVFALVVLAFVAASHAKRRSGSHGRMVFVPCCAGCGEHRLT